ncbi:MAG: LPD38 domain-containing protein [Herbaspirillum sp.]
MDQNTTPLESTAFPAKAQQAVVTQANGGVPDATLPVSHATAAPQAPTAPPAPAPNQSEQSPPSFADAQSQASETPPPSFDEAQAQDKANKETPPSFDEAQAQDQGQPPPAQAEHDDLANMGFNALKTSGAANLEAYIRKNLNLSAKAPQKTQTVTDESGNQRQVNVAQSFPEALLAGLEMSATGKALMQNTPPDMVLANDAPTAYKIASGISSIGGDIPLMMETMGAVGSAGISGDIAGISKSVMAQSAAAFAVPAGIRKWYTDLQEKGSIKSANDFTTRVMSSAWEAIKGGAVGAVVPGAGAVGAAAGDLAPAFAQPIARGIGQFSSELATMVTASSLLEGKLPHVEDFAGAGVMMALFHGTGLLGDNLNMTSKLRRIFTNTGEHPSDVIREAQQNPVVHQELMSLNSDLPAQSVRTDLQHTSDAPLKGDPTVDEANADANAKGGQWELKPQTPSEPDVAPKKGEGELQLSDDEKYFTSKIGEQPESKTPTSSAEDLMFKIASDTLDRSKGLTWAYRKAGVDSSLSDASYLLQKQGASADTYDSFVTDGTRDFNTGKINGEPYVDIAKDYSKVFPEDPTMQKLKAFQLASRVVELDGRNIPITVNGEKLSVEAAKRTVAAGQDTLQPFMDRDVAYGNRGLQYLHDSGYFTPDQFKAMIDMNKSHVSFKRVMTPDEFTGSTGGTGMVRRIIGDGGLIQDPIISRLENTQMMLQLAERNRVTTKLIDDLGHISADQMNVFEGSDNEGTLKDNEISLFRNGEREVYATHPVIADAVNSMADNPSGLFVGGKFLKAFKDVYSAATVNQPVFASMHMARNWWTAPIMSEYGHKIVWSAIKNLPEYLANNYELPANYIDKGTDFSDLKYEGAFVRSYFDPTEDPVLQKVMNINKQAPILSRAWNSSLNPLQWSHAMITSSDNLIRFADAKLSLANGRTMEDAASSARNVIPDYQIRGAKRNVALTLASFSRVHYGSELQTAGKVATDPLGTALKGAMFISAPSAILWAWNQRDRVTGDQKDFNTDNYLMVRGFPNFVPATADRYNAVRGYDPRMTRATPDGKLYVDDSPTYRWKYPFTLGTAFGGGMTAALNSIKNKNPDALEGWVKDVFASTTSSLVPTAAVPIIEQATNHQLSTGRPLVSALSEKSLPELEQRPYTSETAIQVAKIMHSIGGGKIGPENLTLDNPLVIDNYIHQWGGTLGRAAVQVLDKGLHEAGVGDTSPQPDKQWADNVFAKAFLIRNTSYSTQAVYDLYDAARLENQTKESYKKAIGDGDQQTMDYIQQNHMSDINGSAEVAKSIGRQISVINMVKSDKTMTSLDKTQLMENMMWGIMASANKGMDQVKATKASIQNTIKGGQ